MFILSGCVRNRYTRVAWIRRCFGLTGLLEALIIFPVSLFDLLVDCHSSSCWEAFFEFSNIILFSRNGAIEANSGDLRWCTSGFGAMRIGWCWGFLWDFRTCRESNLGSCWVFLCAITPLESSDAVTSSHTCDAKVSYYRLQRSTNEKMIPSCRNVDAKVLTASNASILPQWPN